FIWIIKQFFQKTWEDSPAYKLKYWPIINFLLNSAWILVFTQQMILASVIVIFALLITLIIMHILITNQNINWFDRFSFYLLFFLFYLRLSIIVGLSVSLILFILPGSQSLLLLMCSS